MKRMAHLATVQAFRSQKFKNRSCMNSIQYKTRSSIIFVPKKVLCEYVITYPYPLLCFTSVLNYLCQPLTLYEIHLILSSLIAW